MKTSKKILSAFWAALAGILLSSCATPPPLEPKAGLYKEYDEKVNALRDAVNRGEMTVAEAEIHRQEAFREYRKQVEEKQVQMEYRNY